MARYRKIDTRIWNDRKFRALSDAAKLVFFFLLTHPHMTSLGAMRASIGGLAGELGWAEKAFREAFGEVSRKGMAKHDPGASCMVVPNFLRYNGPESPNVVKSWAAALDLVPECDYRSELIRQVKAFTEALPQAFREALPEVFIKSMPNPEQEQEQEQELQVSTTTSACSSPTLIPSSRNGTNADGTESVLATAVPWGMPEGLVRLYHELVPPDHPRVATLSPARHKNLVAALKKFPERAHWELVFSEISRSPFLLGQRPSKDHPHFRADLDWLLQGGRQAGSVENHVKVADGKYRDGPAPLSAGAQKMLAWRPRATVREAQP